MVGIGRSGRKDKRRREDQDRIFQAHEQSGPDPRHYAREGNGGSRRRRRKRKLKMPVTLINPYCPLAQLKDELKIKQSDTSADDHLLDSINQASRWIDRYTGRR